jgi:hypothetical protein
MTQKLLLVDFENVQQIDLARLDDSYRIIIFVGAGQKNVPIALVVDAQKLGNRLEWQRVDAKGNNALDFFIACQLGRVLEKSPRLRCLVLSKDKGFDPLLRHLNKIGLKCNRLNSLLELDPKVTQADQSNPNYKRVVELRLLTRPGTQTRSIRWPGTSGLNWTGFCLYQAVKHRVPKSLPS